MRNYITQFKYWIIFPLVLVFSIQIEAQVTLSATLGAADYQWYRDNVSIVGANADEYIAPFPGVYHAIFLGTDNCKQSTNYFVLVDNCNQGDEVNLTLGPSYSHNTIEWSTGNFGLTETVIATKSGTTYSATISSTDARNSIYQFSVMQFDSICCDIKGVGTITLMPLK